MSLKADQVCFTYPRDVSRRKILDKVSFEVNQGEILSILGPNGSGKSTLMNCLSGLFKPNSGDIYVSGQNVKQLSVRQLAHKMAYVPQTHNPAFSYTVRDFIVMGRTPYINVFSQPSELDFEITDKMIKELGIGKLADKKYTEISGGERQQVMIARALVQEPEIVLLDEPTSHLDFGNQQRTLELASNLSKRNIAVVMSTHVPDHVIMLGDKVGLLDQHGHMEFGFVDDILGEEALSKLYNFPLKMVYIKEVERFTCIALKK